ncbi:hypothetical protein QUB80_33260 [Chlorogloeopsis sp. ULAP01]|uniref:hypothetical protein n=1 Tax=Chlorogloeopsis sp. ULAP01 TaxID=3056483 RepID=UPI0025AAAD1E|nr:hypothetical protein [Chlorogloeopsis sp. ULAP01]MDM9385526.1 hypothetical protein [Chlorogloeopsis sp. ULAP01]
MTLELKLQPPSSRQLNPISKLKRNHRITANLAILPLFLRSLYLERFENQVNFNTNRPDGSQITINCNAAEFGYEQLYSRDRI